jgi:Tol biopolymer transport system component
MRAGSRKGSRGLRGLAWRRSSPAPASLDDGPAPAAAHLSGRFAAARLRGRIPSLGLVIGALCLCWGVLCSVAVGAPVDFPLVFTQFQAGSGVERQPVSGNPLCVPWGEGARIVRLEPDGTLRVLSEGFAAAADPTVSFDATHILFAGKKQPGDRWNIYEMTATGADVRQITSNLGDCRSPAYMSTVYTLPPPPRVDTDPWVQVMFVSTAAGELSESGSGLASNLYSIKMDGTMTRRLTYNLSGDVDPFLMQDGRILVAGWERADLRRGFLGRVGIFGVNLDGLDYAPYVTEEGERFKRMPVVTTKGLVIFVEGENLSWDGAGHLAAVTTRRNFHSYRRLTRDAEGLYLTPSPLPDGSVLVSRRPTDGGATHALCRYDPDTGRVEVLFDDPAYHDVEAQALVARPVPAGRSTVVKEKAFTGPMLDDEQADEKAPSPAAAGEEVLTGRLYCLNVSSSGLTDLAGMPAGTVKRLRVLEGVPLPQEEQAGYLPEGARTGIGGPGAHAIGLPPMVERRFLGVVPVEEDGSFNIEVPANLPVQLQTVDADGLALATSGWLWVKSRGAQGCIGCHEDPELTPENLLPKAVTNPSRQLLLPPDRRRTVDFRRDLMPIIEAKCAAAGCHATSSQPPALGGGMTLVSHGEAGAYFNQAYESLLAAAEDAPGPLRGHPDHSPVVGRYVVPGRARESRLIWRLFGYDTSSTTAKAGARQAYPFMPPPGSPSLSEAERMTFIEWVDLGALWDGIPGSDPYPGGGAGAARGGRS